MLHQKFALLRERLECGERLDAWIHSNSDWFPRLRQNVCCVAPSPAEQCAQSRPLVGIELVDEEHQVAPRSTASKIERDPVGADYRSRSETSLAGARERHVPSRVLRNDDRKRVRPRPPDRGMSGDDEERCELRQPGPSDEQGRRNEQHVQGAPPEPNEPRRFRRQKQRWRGCAR
jgi:hypothetical protein